MNHPIDPSAGLPGPAQVAPTPRSPRSEGGAPAPPDDRRAAVTPEVRDQAIESLKTVGDRIQVGHHVAEFSYDERVDRVIVRIYSDVREPRELVRQIPPEEYLRFVAKYRELLGVLFDETV